MNAVLTVADVVASLARLAPGKVGARDSRRALSFQQWGERATRLANGLLDLGLVKGDRAALLAYNCLEWLALYVGLARAGLVAVPINFRLVGPEIRYIVRHCEARPFVVQDQLADGAVAIGAELDIARRALCPGVTVNPEDIWALMYTSGTTGRRKGAIRSHGATALMSLVAAIDMVPTHYIMMLGLPDSTKAKYDVSGITKLVISSAPARRETKLAIMEHFSNSGLFELYGSTEAGWVTLLRPDEQLAKLGSVGREWTGSGPIPLARPDHRAERRPANPPGQLEGGEGGLDPHQQPPFQGRRHLYLARRPGVHEASEEVGELASSELLRCGWRLWAGFDRSGGPWEIGRRDRGRHRPRPVCPLESPSHHRRTSFIRRHGRLGTGRTSVHSPGSEKVPETREEVPNRL